MLDQVRTLLATSGVRLRHAAARAILALVDDSGGTQRLQLTRYDSTVLDDGIERFAEYGFTSVPFAGAEAAALYLAGDRGHGLVVAVNDRRYRLTGLASGEVAIHDDQGAKVHLTRAGIVIDGGGKPLTVQNAPTVTMKAATKLRVETPRLEVTGDIVDQCDSQARTIADMRETYDIHTHQDPQGGKVAPPDQQM